MGGVRPKYSRWFFVRCVARGIEIDPADALDERLGKAVIDQINMQRLVGAGGDPAGVAGRNADGPAQRYEDVRVFAATPLARRENRGGRIPVAVAVVLEPIHHEVVNPFELRHVVLPPGGRLVCRRFDSWIV